VGLLGGILTYAVEAGIIESNPAHGIRKPKDNVRKRRLSEAEYRILGRMLRDAAKQEKYTTIVDIIRQIALTGCRRSEMIGLKWTEADTEASCLRLEDSKEGESIRPIGLPVVEYLERRLCLSEIKHAHTDDGVRQIMALAQCDQRNALFAASGRPC
jgi:integrase